LSSRRTRTIPSQRIVKPVSELQHKRATAAELGIAAPPGTTYDVDPAGHATPLYTPQNGQQVVSGPGQPYREAPVPGSIHDPTSAENIITGEGKLRDDYEAQLKPYVVAREGYQKVIQGAAQGNPAGSICALMFGYMKTLDPGSTVREGEYRRPCRTRATIPQTIQNMYNKLLAGDGHADRLSSGRSSSSSAQRPVRRSTRRPLTRRNERFGGLASGLRLQARAGGAPVRPHPAVQPDAAPAAAGPRPTRRRRPAG
jgi:hypothetical protein